MLTTLLLWFAIAAIKAVRAAGTTRFRTALLCQHTHMTIVIADTAQQFSGTVYTEGHYSDEECRFAMDTKLTLQLPYDKCGTVDSGGSYSNVLIVQKHPKMMTAEDESFKVICDKSSLQTSQGSEIHSDSLYMERTAKEGEQVFADVQLVNKSKVIFATR